MTEKLTSNEVRKHIGVSFPGLAVVSLCHDGDGNIVLAKRSPGARDEHGCWDLCAGAVEVEESVEETVRREILEEYGCEDIGEINFLGYYDAFRTNNSEQETHWVSLVFLVQVERSLVTITEPNKFDDMDWFTLDKFPARLHSQFPQLLQKYGHKIRELMEKKP